MNYKVSWYWWYDKYRIRATYHNSSIIAHRELNLVLETEDVIPGFSFYSSGV
jgi:hypothetical protein